MGQDCCFVFRVSRFEKQLVWDAKTQIISLARLANPESGCDWLVTFDNVNDLFDSSGWNDFSSNFHSRLAGTEVIDVRSDSRPHGVGPMLPPLLKTDRGGVACQLGRN